MPQPERLGLPPLVALISGALAAASCVNVGPYVCAQDDQCVDRAGVLGRCESDRRCSFRDPGCPSGFRYEGRGTCVLGDAGAGDAMGGACPVGDLVRWTFEKDAEGWTTEPLAEGEPAPWTLAEPTDPVCHDGRRCWAQSQAGNYPTCASGTLTSPAVDLSACADANLELELWHSWSFQAYTDGPAPDGGFVQLATGSTWQNAVPGPEDPYVGTIWASELCANQRITNRYRDNLGWAGAGTPGWRKVRIPIVPFFRTSTFRARFVFGSDPFGTARGWLIDDVRIVVKP